MKEEEYLILVDTEDKPIGKMEKSLVHEQGLLHRAFSVFIFNTKGQLLLQQRADEKYHSGGLWTNTCCSHPSYGEEINVAIKRRMAEEMGLRCSVTLGFTFIYKAGVDHGLTEYEFDHVYIGITDDVPQPDPAEVKNWKYMEMNFIASDLGKNPDNYTEWFKLCFDKVEEYYKLRNLRFSFPGI